jgi:hypothetical protein
MVDVNNAPEPMRWKPRFSLLGMAGGVFAGVGASILGQQYGRFAMTTSQAVKGVAFGLLSGILIPSTIFAVVVVIYNRRLAGVRARLPRTAVAMVLLVGATLAVGIAGSGSARAAGSCTGTVNGQDVMHGGIVSVAKDQDVTAVFGAGQAITSGTLSVIYGPLTVVDTSATSSSAAGSDPGTLTKTVSYADIADKGVGQFAIDGNVVLADGSTCSTSFIADIAGDPLSTPLGQAAAAVTALGSVGVAASAASPIISGVQALSALKALV